MSTQPAATFDSLPPRFVQPRPIIRWIAVIVALAGWVMSWQLLMASAGLSAPLADAVCAAGGGAADDCDAVLRSQWAYIGKPDNLARVPVAALGMAYFAFLGLWHLLVGTPTRGQAGWHVVLLPIIALGAWFSTDLLRVMFGELHRTCTGCLVVHALNIALIVLTILAWPWRARTATVPHPSFRLGAGALLACTSVAMLHLLFAASMNAVNSMRQLTTAYTKIVDDPGYVKWNYERQPVEEIPTAPDAALLGDAAAPNSVIVFADFQCAACRQAHELLDKLARDHPALLRVEFRNFPQDPECNPNPRFKVGGHPVACKAARAAEAVRVISGPTAFHEMCRRLFEAQHELESRSFATLAVGAEAQSAEAFDAAWYSPEVAERVRADVSLGAALGIESVPAIYLNGRRLENWRKRETWEALAGIPPLTTQPGR